MPEYLRLRKRIITNNSPQLHIVNASKHNIKNLSTTIPLSKLVCIAGVSGSGKSTFAQNIIYEGMTSNTKTQTIKSDILFNETIFVDQSSVVKSLGQIPHFIPILGCTNKALAELNRLKRLGFSSADFSFNGGNGRCDSCGGLGYEQVEMQFLSDIQLPCNYCNGKRFKDEILEVEINGLNILDVLNLTIDEGVESFAHLPKHIETFLTTRGWSRLFKIRTTFKHFIWRRISKTLNWSNT